MSTLLHWFTSPEWAQVVKALLHSLWQGALIALALAIVLRRLTNPAARYRFALAALTAILFATVLTWAVINSAAHRPAPPAYVPSPVAQQPPAFDPVPTPEPYSSSEAVVFMGRKTTNIRWTAWLAFAWLAGALLMLSRAGFKVAAAEQLRRSCRPLKDLRVEILLAETRRTLGIANQIRVGITDKLTSPAVVGVVVPMLILPLALLTTLTPEQIRFVLLHELAHIRRRDYLANLFQFFAESLLFFNPAVWWISHQIRREREACCDALATELSGAPGDYAQTLVRVAEQILQPAPAAAPAFGNKREPSTLADRIQRLLIPGYRPSLRLTWRAMLAALIFGSILLFLSAIGTRITVAAILTPQQRIDEIKKKAVEYGALPEGDLSRGRRTGEQTSVTAHVRTSDGSPLPEKLFAWLYSQSGTPQHRSGSLSGANVKKNGTIDGKTPSGQIWIQADAEGFAPAIAGPFDASETNRLDAGELVLDRGFEFTLHVVDAKSGIAIPNAALHAQFWLRSTGSGIQGPRDVKADSKGMVVLAHCIDQPLAITVNAPDHEITDVRFESLHAGETQDLKLIPGAQIAGTITDKTTGQPIAGATVRMIYQKGSTTGHYEWNDPLRHLATTGADGRFIANQLRPATMYWLGISAPGHESVLLDNQPTGQQDLRVQLGPELIVRGKVLGDIKGLQRMDKHYALYLTYSEVIGNCSWGKQDWVYLHEADGVTRFEFTNPVAGPVSLNGFKKDVNTPIDDWTIDLNQAPETAVATNVPKREVIFRFKDSSGTPPQGTVSIDVPDSLDPKHLTAHPEVLEITNGEVHSEIAIGGRTSIKPENMIGYWFDQWGRNNLVSIEVTSGPGPMVIEVPVIPAGAIYAKARNADGTPAGGLFFGIQELKRAPGRAENGPLDNGGDSMSDNLPRKWVSSPLPLGGTYRVTGHRGNSFCVSRPLKLTGENPTAEVELQFAPTLTLEGTVLDANGRPVPNADLQGTFTLSQENSFGLDPVFTDADGHFRMENVTADLGDYSIEPLTPGMMAERVQLDFKTQPQVIRLKPGRKIAGRIVEAGTSNVIPGAEIRAVNLTNLKLPSVTTHSDTNGNFNLTQLATGDYRFFVQGGEQTASQQTYRSDIDTNITLAVKLSPWSTLKSIPRATNSGSTSGATNVVLAQFFNIDSNKLYLLAVKDGKPSISDTLANYHKYILPPNNTNVPFFTIPGPGKFAGVMLDWPEEGVLYNERSSELTVRATPAELTKIEAALDELSDKTPEQIRTSHDEQIQIAQLVQDGKLIFQLGKMDEAEATLTEVLRRDPNNQAALYYLSLVKESRGETNGISGHLPKPNLYARSNVVYTSPQRQKVFEKLNEIVFDRIAFPNLPLSEVVRQLTEQTKLRDPEKEGVKFVLGFGPEMPPVDFENVQISLDPGFQNVRLMDVLDAIVRTADRPIKYSISDNGIVFSPKGSETPELFTRVFKVDPMAFLTGLQNVGAITFGTTSAASSTNRNRSRYLPKPGQSGDIQTAVVNFFAAVGVSLTPPKTVFYNDRQGTLTVHATADDLDMIEAAVDTLNIAPPEVNLKVRIVEVSQTDNKALGFEWYLGNFLIAGGTNAAMTSSQPSFTNATSTTNPRGAFPGGTHGIRIAPSTNATNYQPTACGVLTDEQFRVVLNALQQRSGTELLNEADATTLSGRQVEFKVPGAQTNADTGITLDVTPYVCADGSTIQMTVIPTFTVFRNYDDPGKFIQTVTVTNTPGVPITGNLPLPHSRVRQITLSNIIQDGQTLVLTGLQFTGNIPFLGDLPLVGRLFTTDTNQTQRKSLIIFVTPTIVQPATNHIHSEDYYDGPIFGGGFGNGGGGGFRGSQTF
jgi:beta-lactamase regulating signal transducer with metallopeptidase domain